VQPPQPALTAFSNNVSFGASSAFEIVAFIVNAVVGNVGAGVICIVGFGVGATTSVNSVSFVSFIITRVSYGLMAARVFCPTAASKRTDIITAAVIATPVLVHSSVPQ
jgi:hypothetical protein